MSNTEENTPSTEPSNTDIGSKRARAWCFTYNNPDDGGGAHLAHHFEVVEDSCRFVMQEEVGESGTPHIQGVAHFKNARTLAGIKRINPVIHWEPCKNLRASVRYCTKSESRVPGGMRWAKGYDLPVEIADPMSGKVLHWWQEEINVIINGPVHDRRLYWYWDPVGKTGKSSFCKHLCLKRGAVLFQGASKDSLYAITQMKTAPKICIFDIPRTSKDYMNYGLLEVVKNGAFFSPKYKSSMFMMNPPHVIIFANFPPEGGKVSEDRWEITSVSTGTIREGVYARSTQPPGWGEPGYPWLDAGGDVD